MAGIKRRLGSLLGPGGKDGEDGITPEFAEGNTTQVSPGEPAKVELVEISEGQYRVDAQVPRGLDGDPNAVGEFGDAMAVELNTEGSVGRTALANHGVRAVAQTQGAFFVFSENEPEHATMYGVPVIWVAPEPNYVPEVSIDSLTVEHLNVELHFSGHDPDGDPITFMVDWGDGNQTTNTTSTATHTYALGGLYTVTVTVDDGRATSTASSTVYTYEPLPGRWGADEFSYPDGTILAGWVTDTQPEPPVTLETGSLVWGPLDQTIGGGGTTRKAEVHDGKFTADPESSALRSQATIANLPDDSYRISFQYTMDPDNTLDYVGVYLACSPTTSRTDTGTTSYGIRIQRTGWVEFFNQVDGTWTNTGEQYSLSQHDGHIEVTYAADTGVVTLSHNGEQFAERVYDGTPYPKVGIDTRGTATIDDFEIGPL